MWIPRDPLHCIARFELRGCQCSAGLTFTSQTEHTFCERFHRACGFHRRASAFKAHTTASGRVRRCSQWYGGTRRPGMPDQSLRQAGHCDTAPWARSVSACQRNSDKVESIQWRHQLTRLKQPRHMARLHIERAWMSSQQQTHVMSATSNTVPY